jgi:hypothetical protein
MMRTLGRVFGGAFLFGGVLGFVPGVTKDGLYLGVFMVNPAHNGLHIASGSVFLAATSLGAGAVRLWFQVFGAAYAAIAAAGFWVGDGLICGVISNNRYDAWGHAALALAMLVIGFAFAKPSTAATA